MTRRAPNGCWCRTASKSGSTATGADAKPTRSSTSPVSTSQTNCAACGKSLAREISSAGATERLLRETDAAYKDVTDRLYKEYSELRERLIEFLVQFRRWAEARARRGDRAGAENPRPHPLHRLRPAARPDARRPAATRAQVPATSSIRSRSGNNFLGLFRRVDKGDHDMDIPPYNGGLFANDAVVDSLDAARSTSPRTSPRSANWDYRREVPVTVLGHIFEQSITDIEKKRAEARGEAPPKVSRTQARRASSTRRTW